MWKIVSAVGVLFLLCVQAPAAAPICNTSAKDVLLHAKPGMEARYRLRVPGFEGQRCWFARKPRLVHVAAPAPRPRPPVADVAPLKADIEFVGPPSPSPAPIAAVVAPSGVYDTITITVSPAHTWDEDLYQQTRRALQRADELYRRGYSHQ